ncbi:MAG: hypothetical protein KBD78_12220 [Oligoflexales bacterium]|nr:hypothetical protein [Oligoflexales bacterium]
MIIEEPKTIKGTNPFLAKALAAANNKMLPLFIRQQCCEKRGIWRRYFADRMGEKPAEVHVDIGSYKGKTILELAQSFPDRAFIGVDLTYKRVFLSAERGEKLGLRNVAWCLWDAKKIKEIFSEDEVSGVSVFFPDPWANKKSQKKHRLISNDFVEQMRSILENKGYFWLKTDHHEYFTEACLILKRLGVGLNEDSEHFEYAKKIGRTLFEELFHTQGKGTFSRIWYKELDGSG